MSNESTLSTPIRVLQLGSVRYEYTLTDLAAYTDSGLMVPMGHFAQQIGLPQAFHRFLHIKQKAYRHDPVDKLLTFFISLVEGCGYTSDINTRLKPFPAIAHAWGLPYFADQGLVNDTLHALRLDNLQEIEELYQYLFRHNSLALKQSKAEPLIVDVDMKGIPVSPSSQRFEWATPGYFPHRRGSKGLQLTAAFVGANLREALGCTLAPGYAHITSQFPVILTLIEKRLGAPPPRVELMRWRAAKLLAQAEGREQKAQAQDEAVVELWRHISDVRLRAGKHQAEIMALTARGQRLPDRMPRYRLQIAAHERLIEWYRQLEQKDRSRIERRCAKAIELQEQAALLREGANNLLALANSPPELGAGRVILIRGDASLGSGETAMILMERGYLFVLMGYSAKLAHKLAGKITASEWRTVDPTLRVAEAKTRFVAHCPYALRIIVRERTKQDGRVEYSYQLDNLPPSLGDMVEVVQFYNERQTIEAFNKVVGNVLNLNHLRTGSIVSNMAVAQMGMLAHTFLSWAAHEFFAGTPYEGIGIRELVEKGIRVIARVSWPESQRCHTELATSSPYAQAFVSGPKCPDGQLVLPFQHLP